MRRPYSGEWHFPAWFWYIVWVCWLAGLVVIVYSVYQIGAALVHGTAPPGTAPPGRAAQSTAQHRRCPPGNWRASAFMPTENIDHTGPGCAVQIIAPPRKANGDGL